MPAPEETRQTRRTYTSNLTLEQADRYFTEKRMALGMLNFPHIRYDDKAVAETGFEVQFIDVAERALADDTGKLVKIVNGLFVAMNPSRAISESYTFEIGPEKKVIINLDD